MIGTSSEDLPPLLDLSSEIKDGIASNLREYLDLLSLALTHSIWRDVIIPDHLHYRTVWAEPQSNDHWEHLLGNRRRSDNVQVLHVGSSLQRRTPWYEPPEERDYNAEYILSRAIKSFPNLRSFKFAEDGMSGDVSYGEDGDVTLWDQLERSCPYLEEVDVEGVFACPGCIFNAGDTRKKPSPVRCIAC